MIKTPALVISVLALAAQVHSQIKPHRSLDDATRKTLEAAMKRHPFEAFRALGKGEEDPTLSAWLGRFDTPAIGDALDTAALAGLWSNDPEVTRGALIFIDERQMDIADIERYQKFALPIFASTPGLDDLVNFRTFKHTASRDDTTKILKKTPHPHSSYRFNFTGPLHRSFRPEHIPVLAELARTRDPFLREDAFKGLGGIAHYTDQHRDLIAKSILEWPGLVPNNLKDANKLPGDFPAFKPRSYSLPDKQTGLSPLLHATLHRLFVDSAEKLNNGIAPWLLRWTADSKADATDRELLLSLLALSSEDAQRIALLGLRHLNDDNSRAAIEKALPTLQGHATEALAYATLAAHGIDKWRAALLERAAEDTDMCTAALAVIPELAVNSWAANALTGESARGLKAISLLKGTLHMAPYCPFRIADSTYNLIEQAVLKRCDSLDAARLGAVFDQLPCCRSLALSRAFLRKVTPRALTKSQVRFLLVADEAGLRAKLASWLDDAAGARHALDALLTIGSPEHGERILQHFKTKPESKRNLLTLARSGSSSAVRDYLAAGLVGTEKAPIPKQWMKHLTAYCRALGLPNGLCWTWTSALKNIPKDIVQRDYSQWREAVLAGKATDVLIATLRAMPLRSLDFSYLSQVKDPRVIELLREVCDLQGANYQWAITELAASGDKDARQVFQLCLDRSYYGWHEYLDGRLLTLGQDRSLIPYWIGEAESNCCRRVHAGQALESIFGIDVTETGDRSLLTARAWAESWWRRNAERLRWSDLAGRYIIGPR